MDKFLSIIIPVYNVERYLAECLDSCLNQDIPVEDYEIICVNDGSTDGSAEILERYAREHSNIRVITQPNGGVSVARNAGLDVALGEYIWFVDSDDFLLPNCLGLLYHATNKMPVDQLSIAYYECENALTEAEKVQASAHTLTPCTISQGASSCLSLHRHAFLKQHGLRYLEGISYGEDLLFMEAIAHCSPVVSKIDTVIYFYRRNPNSVTRTHTTEATRKRIDSAYQFALVLTDYAKSDLQQLREKQSEHDMYVRTLMPAVRRIVTAISTPQFPPKLRRDVLRRLSNAELFPLFLYRGFRNRFPQKCHMNHAHMGLKGKIVDILNFYSTTRLGFAALALYYKLYYKLKKGGHL